MIRLASLVLAACCLAAAAQGAEPAERPTMAEFVGLNGHFHFKPALYRPTTRLVRNYHNINWDVTVPGDPITLPVCVNKVDWDRNLYGPIRDAGYEISLCAMFGGFGEKHEGYRELWTGQEAWCRAYGEALARHFGPQGQGSVQAIEIGNEPGADFDDALYRSIFRNMAEGIRAGDPSITIVTCTAQARAADTYAKDLRETFADPSLLELVDVLNVHTYAQFEREEGGPKSPWTRAYPESAETPYLELVDEVVAWRDEHAPGKAIWITEFGYDACTDEAMAKRTGWFEKLDWQGVTDLQQAQYLVRSIMLFARRPIDRAYIYFYDDKDSPSVHGCAGLTRNFEPKPSYHAIAQLQTLLGDHRFDRVVRQDEQAYVYAFSAEAGPEIWVAWSPTGVRTDRKDQHVPVETAITLADLPAAVARVEAMATAAGDAAEVAVDAADGVLEMTVGESPAYILFAE